MDPATLRDPRLLAQLAARTRPDDDLDRVAERQLARYFALLARELATLTLTAHQAELLLHAVAAAELARERGEPFGSFAESVESEVKRLHGIHQHHGIKVDDLAEQVAAWSPARTLAVIDACERFVARGLRGATEPMPTMLRAVGLLRDGTVE